MYFPRPLTYNSFWDKNAYSGEIQHSAKFDFGWTLVAPSLTLTKYPTENFRNDFWRVSQRLFLFMLLSPGDRSQRPPPLRWWKIHSPIRAGVSDHPYSEAVICHIMTCYLYNNSLPPGHFCHLLTSVSKGGQHMDMQDHRKNSSNHPALLLISNNFQ